MSKITTEDCKSFLVSHFDTLNITTTTKDWKRVSKYKENNIWIRDFSHPSIGNISLQEIDDIISIYSPTINNSYELTTFSDIYIEKAKELLKKFLDLYEDGRTSDIIKEPDWAEYSVAIPSLFNFYFPYGDYNNDDESLENLKNGLNSSVLLNDSDSLCVYMYSNIGYEPDDYAQDILNYILPNYMSFMDEYNLDFSKDMSISDVIKMLMKMGFKYTPEEDYSYNEMHEDNVFKQNINYSTVIFNANNNNEHSTTKEKFNIQRIIKLDDEKSLQDLINNGLDVNLSLSKSNLFEFCCNNQSIKCAKTLLDNQLNLFDYDSLDRKRLNIIHVSHCFENNFDYIINLLQSQHIIDENLDVLHHVIRCLPNQKNPEFSNKIIDFICENISEKNKYNLLTLSVDELITLNRIDDFKNSINFADEQVISNLLYLNSHSSIIFGSSSFFGSNFQISKLIVSSLNPKLINLNNLFIKEQPILDYYLSLEKEFTDEIKEDSKSRFSISYSFGNKQISDSDIKKNKLNLVIDIIRELNILKRKSNFKL